MKLLTAQEVASIVGVTTQTVYLWVKKGKLKKMNLPGRGVRFAEADVLRIVREDDGANLAALAAHEDGRDYKWAQVVGVTNEEWTRYDRRGRRALVKGKLDDAYLKFDAFQEET